MSVTEVELLIKRLKDLGSDVRTEARWGELRLATFLLLVRSPEHWMWQQVAQPLAVRLIPRKW
jgi:hypothetical protein